jgi:hypothetical protein
MATFTDEKKKKRGTTKYKKPRADKGSIKVIALNKIPA